MQISVDHLPSSTPTTTGNRRLLTTAVVTAPLALFTAWLIMWPFGGRHSPGLGWTLGHLAWCVGFVGLAVVVLEVRNRLQRIGGQPTRVPDTLAGLALFGLCTGVMQMLVDLYAGWRSSTQAATSALADRMTDDPGVDLVLYTVGPLLVLVAMTALFTLLARARDLPWWIPVVVVLGIAALMSNETAVMPIGLTLLWVGFSPLLVQPAGQHRPST